MTAAFASRPLREVGGH